MKTCFNTITAGLDRRLEDIIAACGRAGYQGMEIDLRAIEAAADRVSLADIRRLMDDHGMATASVMAFDLAPFATDDAAFERLRRGAAAAQALGAPILLTYCFAAIPEGMDREAALDTAAARAARYADAAGLVKIALEPIGRTALMGGPSAALEIARRSGRPNVGIMMDTFHYYLSQVPEADIIAIPRDDLLIVHVNDSEDHAIAELKDAHRVHLGRGILPLARDRRLIREIGYEGFVSVEIFNESYWTPATRAGGRRVQGCARPMACRKGRMMRIGFYTSTFNDRPVEEVLDFAVGAGFDAIELDAGSHIGEPENVAEVVGLARAPRSRGLLDRALRQPARPDHARRREFHARTTDLARATEAAAVPTLVLFPGRDSTVSEDENYAAFAKHATALLAATEKLCLAMENWPGPDNDYIATTPAGWDKLFAQVPDPRLGLEFDPSHLIRMGVDPYAAFDKVAHRVQASARQGRLDRSGAPAGSRLPRRRLVALPPPRQWSPRLDRVPCPGSGIGVRRSRLDRA